MNTTHLKGALEGFFSRVHKLVAFEFARLDEGLSALTTDVHSRSMGVEVFAHRRGVTEGFAATQLGADHASRAS